MAFNPNNYKVSEPKKLPVILLLDVSGSMRGQKIDSLYDATVDMIETFAVAQAKEQIVDIAIITFGDRVEIHTPYTSVMDLQSKGLSRFYAGGETLMGAAINKAKEMIEDREITSSRVYRPAVILVSDGMPGDNWQLAMDAFVNNGRSMKCQRFAVAIGSDANRDVLERFTQDPNTVFFASDAKDIAEQFKIITMSVSTRAASKNPYEIHLSSLGQIPNLNPDTDDDLY